MKNAIFGIVICLCALFVSVLSSCKHDPTLLGDDPIMPIDTTGTGGGGGGVDTTMTGEPCNPDLIYFQQDILPLLISNCALSGCHNDASAEDGVILTSYEKVIETADVEPFDLNGSKMYRVITDDDPDDRMPPAPNNPLSNDQINTITKWILQGAKNLECDPNSGGCNTSDARYSNVVRPTIQTYCQGCHSGATPAAGIDLSTYDGVKTVAQNGRLIGAINWDPAYENMPQGGAKLPECTIDQIEAWVNAGAQNN